MSVQYVFPFCVVSELGQNQTVTGSITVNIVTRGISKTLDFIAETTTWQNQTANKKITVDIPYNDFIPGEVTVDITAAVDQPDCVVVVMEPKVIDPKFFTVLQYFRQQKILDSDFIHKETWFNLPIKNNQLSRSYIVWYLGEVPTKTGVLHSIADNITYYDEMTYVERTGNKNLPIEENIEYYLGKDRMQNLYFDARIPTSNEIPRTAHNPPKLLTNTTVNGFGPTAGDDTEYHYNNLGYRSTFDYTKETLKDKRLILCLGDSDTFGTGVKHEDLWSELLETDATVLNMGIPGLSSDGVAKIGAQTIQALHDQIDAVLVQYPLMSLREFVSKTYNGGVHTHVNYNLPYDDWWKHIDWKSNNYNFNKNRLLLDSICGKYNIKYFDLYINRADNKIPYDFNGFNVYTAFGPHTHRAIAKYFSRKLNNQPSLFQELTQS